MNIEDFIESVADFTRLSHTERILALAWFNHRFNGKSEFRSRDISSMFDRIPVERPSSVSSFLHSLSKRKPPALVRRKEVYLLERRTLATLDSQFGLRESTIEVHKLLQGLSDKLSSGVEKTYLEEAITCFRHRAFRAAVVMTWNLAFDHLCQHILQHKLAEFNAQLTKTFPKANPASVSSRDDLTALKESEVLQVAKSASIISGSLHKVMKEKLDRRNIAAHPSGIRFTQLTAEEYITDLVENVVLKVTI